MTAKPKPKNDTPPKAPKGPPLVIGIPLYHGVDFLDVAAPCEIFSWLAEMWTARDVQVYVLGKSCDAVLTRSKQPIVPQKTFDEMPHLDLLWVPGGNPPDLKRLMGDQAFLAQLRAWSTNATYVTSVCEGAMLLAAAGLLDGHRATTHWAFLPCLRKYHRVTVLGPDDGYPRYVVDPPKPPPNARGVRVTGAGISAGLDEALGIVMLLAGEDMAKQVQSMTQYFPKPPVHAPPPVPGTCPLDGISSSS